MLTLSMIYGKNKGLAMSPAELVSTYLYGITTKAADGSLISDATYELYIKAAQEEMEKFLDIRLQKQVIESDYTLYKNDFDAWGMITTDFPVVEAYQLHGYFNDQLQIEYDETWLSSKTTNVGMPDRIVNIVPPTKGYAPLMHHAITPYVGMHRIDHFPNYWKLKYCTGFDKAPADITNFIGKLAAINIFNLLGDLILGAGIAGQSISIDGLSQSIQTTSSAENSGYSSRVKAYLADLKESLPRLRNYYTGLRFASC